MKNIDCEIYIKQLISFFENNPGDLMELIGDVQKEDFYLKLREKSENNVDEGLDHVLSRQQMIDIVVKLHGGDKKEVETTKIDNLFIFTNYGEFCLN